MQGLNEKEQKAYDLLTQVCSRSFLGFCIRDMVGKGTPEALRDAVQQIKSQARDSEERMRSFLGEETYEAVMQC